VSLSLSSVGGSLYKKKTLKIIILGKTDTGKTFLSFRLVKEFLKLKRKVGILCSDLGQSCIGPPGCVSFKLFSSLRRTPSSYVPADFMEFVGTLSPSGNLANHLLATKMVLDKALAKAEVIIINTTGYIKGEEARFLKFSKIRITKPDIIVALQEKDELEKILNFFEGTIYIVRLKRSERVKKRSAEERASFREKLFHAYFKRAKIVNFFAKSCFKENMVVGLLDKRLATLGLGRIEKVEKHKVKVLIPYSVEAKRVKYLLPSLIFISS